MLNQMNEASQRIERINFKKLARGLGLFGLGLGLMEVLFPREVQQVAGIQPRYNRITRLMGLREIFHALLIFIQPQPRLGVWTRVAGDAADLFGLGAAFASSGVQKDRLSIATASVAGIAALDLWTALELNRENQLEEGEE